LSGNKKTQYSKKRDKNTAQIDAILFPMPHCSDTIEKNSHFQLDSLKKEEQKLLVQKRQLLDTIDELQSRFDDISDKKSRLLVEMERNLISKHQNDESRSRYMLFSVFTWGTSWTDGLVFTVMAETEVWAEELVREWLCSNGRENHKIDKVMALVSRDTRGIINVGAKLLDV